MHVRLQAIAGSAGLQAKYMIEVAVRLQQVAYLQLLLGYKCFQLRLLFGKIGAGVYYGCLAAGRKQHISIFGQWIEGEPCNAQHVVYV